MLHITYLLIPDTVSEKRSIFELRKFYRIYTFKLIKLMSDPGQHRRRGAASDVVFCKHV